MNRRTILAAVGTTTGALAGCVSDRTDGGNAGGETGDEQHAATANGSTGSTDGTVRSHFETEPTRPECELESETVTVKSGGETETAETATTIPYPDPPDSFADDAVVEYVEAFDHAHLTHDVLCDRQGSDGAILSISHAVRARETFDRTDGITHVFLLRAAGATAGVSGNGQKWAADIGYGGVVYAVDETGVARAGFPEARPGKTGELESEAPDPLTDGTLVAAFD
ncbi:hypothetical protein [Halopiger aswanensis]|uniref:Uncharacterized protein n=1 Tax=Halopiger aswanensis TaxID=148449 RepID=A0A3R7FYG7_9EURY|nr:hypothetical protein [Halopiger aswanensis]RKD98182.1 hypothetical protein ATJ93_1187 [Halopiger aswanensis]